MAAQAKCHVCDFNDEDAFNFCLMCGTELFADEEKRQIEHYFFRGYSYRSIVALLSKQHGIEMRERTLKSRLRDYGLRRMLPVYDLEKVKQRVAEELDGPGCMGGYRPMWHTLRIEGLQVPRHVFEAVTRELAPPGEGGTPQHFGEICLSMLDKRRHSKVTCEI